MFKKLCLFLTAMLLSAFVLASPAQQERQEFCVFVANNAAQAAAAKQLKMSQSDFENKLNEYLLVLFMQTIPSGVLTEDQFNEIALAMKEGYAQGRPPAVAGEAAFNACMNKKST